MAFRYSAPVHNWTKNGTVYTLGDCEQYTLVSAMNDATTITDSIVGPAGTATWAANNVPINISKKLCADTRLTPEARNATE